MVFITPSWSQFQGYQWLMNPWDLLISELYRYMQPPKTRRLKKQDIADVYLIESELRSNMDAMFSEVEDLDTLWVPWPRMISKFLRGISGSGRFLGSLTWASNPQMKRNDFYNTFSGSEGETKMQCIIFRIWCPWSIFPLKHGYWRRVSIRTPLHKHRRKRRKNIMFKVGIFLQSGCGDPLWLWVLQFRSIVSLPFGHFFNGDQK